MTELRLKDKFSKSQCFCISISGPGSYLRQWIGTQLRPKQFYILSLRYKVNVQLLEKKKKTSVWSLYSVRPLFPVNRPSKKSQFSMACQGLKWMNLLGEGGNEVENGNTPLNSSCHRDRHSLPEHCLQHSGLKIKENSVTYHSFKTEIKDTKIACDWER